ncbi:hypothetical protein JW721_04815 [Candidatus Micrarchaeota archaeon]|nr:hypothetical protein [Candidatus Micrarchaeota archaeon]
MGSANALGVGAFHNLRTFLLKKGMGQEFMGLPKEIARLPGAVRFSFAFYNTLEEVRQAVEDMKTVAREFLGRK